MENRKLLLKSPSSTELGIKDPLAFILNQTCRNHLHSDPAPALITFKRQFSS